MSDPKYLDEKEKELVKPKYDVSSFEAGAGFLKTLEMCVACFQTDADSESDSWQVCKETSDAVFAGMEVAGILPPAPDHRSIVLWSGYPTAPGLRPGVGGCTLRGAITVPVGAQSWHSRPAAPAGTGAASRPGSGICPSPGRECTPWCPSPLSCVPTAHPATPVVWDGVRSLVMHGHVRVCVRDYVPGPVACRGLRGRWS